MYGKDITKHLTDLQDHLRKKWDRDIERMIATRQTVNGKLPWKLYIIGKQKAVHENKYNCNTPLPKTK